MAVAASRPDTSSWPCSPATALATAGVDAGAGAGTGTVATGDTAATAAPTGDPLLVVRVPASSVTSTDPLVSPDHGISTRAPGSFLFLPRCLPPQRPPHR